MRKKNRSLGFAPLEKAHLGREDSLTEFTDFQKQVYRAVLGIPLGQVRTYKWVAEKIGRPRAWRAVGSALNKNPLPLFIPCHRVVKSSGDIGKYSQGIDFKRRLIKLEKNIKDMIE